MIDLDLFFSDISRDVAIATNFLEKWQTPLIFRFGICRRHVSVCVCMSVCHTPELYQNG